MRKMGKTGGDEGERGEGRCLIIQQYQCSLFMALSDGPGGARPTRATASPPKRTGNRRKSVIRYR